MDSAHKWTDEQLEALEKKLSDAYSQAYKEMEKKHFSFMREFDKQHKEIKKQLTSGAISKEQYDSWLSDQAITDRWYSESVDYLSKRAVTADKEAMDIINSSMPGVYAENYNWGTYNIEHDSSINIAFTLHDEDTIRELMKEDQTLLPSAKLNEMKDLRWNKQHFQSAIVQGILQGESIPNMAKRLQSVMNMNLNSATRNARTATTAAENMGRVASYDRAKSMGIDVKKEWLATLDGRTRHSHRQLDGVAINNDQTFDNGCRFPGDPQGPAWEVYNCRCTMVANIAGVDQSKAPRNNRLKGMSYEEWKSELSEKSSKTNHVEREKIDKDNKKKSAKVKADKVGYEEERKKQRENPKKGQGANNDNIAATPRKPRRNIVKDRLERAKVEFNPIKKHERQPFDDEIIRSIGGRDTTGGSCVSLAHCYIANKHGFNVCDFRGGKSREIFSMRTTTEIMTKFDGVVSFTSINQNQIKSALDVLEQASTDKDYLLISGGHGAIVRKIESFNGFRYEYLELQMPTLENGFRSLTPDILKRRFRCEEKSLNKGSYSLLIDCDSLAINKEYQELLGYINTN